MQRLIQDLLAFSRIGTRGKQPELVSSEEAPTQALQNLKVRIEESNANIRYKDLPQVLADNNQLTQVFQNLLGNAMKFGGDKPPKIDIAARKVDGFAEFSLKDHGIGFEPRHAERIFVLFQRLNSREVYEGTGIGLAICKKIVERHGGRIWAESQVGKGATFYFTFPLQPEDLPEDEGSEDYDLPEEAAESVEERAGRLI
jgi:chemotaxis family two-component system sensor kinase Cph1